MSDTVLMVKDHGTKWGAAYGRVLIYVLIAVIPIFLSEFEQHTELDLKPNDWICLWLNAALQAANVIRSFIDPTATDIAKKKAQDQTP